MNLNDLITLAADRTGSLKELAAEMGKHQNRLSEWKRGAAKPDASEVAFLAERAGVPVLLVLDDLHWARKPTLLLLPRLQRNILSDRSFALFTSNHEVLPSSFVHCACTAGICWKRCPLLQCLF